MNPLFDAAREFQLFFERQKWPFCFIGGLAVLRWGEVRMTQDIDISLFVGFSGTQAFFKRMPAKFRGLGHWNRLTRKKQFLIISSTIIISSHPGETIAIQLLTLPLCIL